LAVLMDRIDQDRVVHWMMDARIDG